MGDARTRNLERAAACGDLEASATLLRQQIARTEAKVPCEGGCADPGTFQELKCLNARATSVDRSEQCDGEGRITLSANHRLLLAAYCGDPGARLLTSWCCLRHYLDLPGEGGRCHSSYDLSTWITGLRRHGVWPMLLAANAAAGVTARVLETKYCDHKRNGLPVGEICDNCFDGAQEALDAALTYERCPCAEHQKAWLVSALEDSTIHHEWIPSSMNLTSLRVCIGYAAELVREALVRDSICVRLIRFAKKGK